MLKFLKIFKSTQDDTSVLSTRLRFEAAQDELNAILSELDEMPKISINAAERRIELTAPEQFADEALALPAPDPALEAKTDADQDAVPVEEKAA